MVESLASLAGVITSLAVRGVPARSPPSVAPAGRRKEVAAAGKNRVGTADLRGIVQQIDDPFCWVVAMVTGIGGEGGAQSRAAAAARAVEVEVLTKKPWCPRTNRLQQISPNL